jgi:ribosomal protein S18 acetylase RimI-like enzyme
MDTKPNSRTLAISKVKMKLNGLLRIVFGNIFSHEDIVVFETSYETTFKSVVNKAKIDVRLAYSSDVPKFDRSKKFKEKAIERFKAGHLCFIAEKNGKIVNYIWVCFHEAYIDELERKIRIGSDSAYRYDAYTYPEYRGMGIFPIVLVKAADSLFQNGIKEIYDLVSADNFSSLRSYQKIGSRKMGEITLMKLLSLRRYNCKGVTTKDRSKLMEMFYL